MDLIYLDISMNKLKYNEKLKYIKYFYNYNNIINYKKNNFWKNNIL